MNCVVRSNAPLFACIVLCFSTSARSADTRFAHSDSEARYLHWIDLYDADNRRISPDSDRPYSSVKTCGRCHDYESISHGWHFNAFDPDSVDGREGEPWIWTDPRTGTQLPLSYRDWTHTYNPRSIGLTEWDMTLQFGARVPGGGFAAAAPESFDTNESDAGGEADVNKVGDNASSAETVNRWPLSGTLEIDCMACHAVPGAYDFNQRRDQIGEENFAWAATAALRLGSIDGSVSRIKDDADPEDESTKEKLPKVTYDPSRFGPDGTVFMDLIRKPDSNACFQCHSQRQVGDAGIEPRWNHDEDVHLRAGMVCADCHRNGIDHHIVRGFAEEPHPGNAPVTTLSCTGCHLGDHSESPASKITNRAGRLGSPQPLHAGLPPLHFEKMSCTACHGGPVPRDEALRLMTSLAHGLGSKDHRSGLELPAVVGPVFDKREDGRVYPQRAMWPAFWGALEDDKIRPLSPSSVYDVIRGALRVRRDFIGELVKPELGSSELREVLGDDRAKVEPEQWTDEETAKVEEARSAEGRVLFNEKVAAALEAIEEEWSVERAVYVSSGIVYARGEQPETVTVLEVDDDKATGMISWPLAHNVRPAGWSLGVGGCVECHSDEGKVFTSTVAAVGPGPDRGDSVTMASLQGVPLTQRLTWNQLFQGRKSFKYVIGGSVTILLLTLMVGVGALAARLAGHGRTA